MRIFGGENLRRFDFNGGDQLRGLAIPNWDLQEKQEITQPRTLFLPIDNHVDSTRNYKLNTPNIVKFIMDSTLSNIGRAL